MAAEADSLSGQRGSPTIAIVEDDAGVRAAYDDLICSYGLQSRLYASAEEFLVTAQIALPECIVLDQRLPGISGLELQQKLNEMKCVVPIIFVTSQDDPATRRKAIANGARFFFGKPVDDEEMMHRIFELIGRPSALAD